MFKRLEVTNIIPKATLDKGNRRKSWGYGYNPKYDLIIISKDGTIGSVIEINTLKIALPKPPPVKRIQNYGKKPENQVWEPTELPTKISPAQRDKFDELIDTEMTRRIEGHFFYNGGDITYITGNHYFMLQHCKVEGDYGLFFEPQRMLFIYMEACFADDRCFGICFLKSRRIGFSTVSYAVILNQATLTRDSLFGIVSKTGDDASSVFGKLVKSFRSMPNWMKPMTASVAKKELVLDEPLEKISKNNKVVEESEGLRTTINWKSTALNSYDSERLKVGFFDEVSKFPKDVPFNKYWPIVRTTLRRGFLIVGKAIVGSTANELSKGGNEFKEVYFNSKPYKENNYGGRGADGRTASGLYNLFIPADENYEGCFDIHGRIVKEDPDEPVLGLHGGYIYAGSKTLLKQEREGKPTKEEQYEGMRQFPMNEQEAFRDPINISNFNVTKIYEQIEQINDAMAKSPVIRGDFLWKNGERGSEVIWKPNKDGRFYVSWLPPEDMRNKYFVKGGRKFPANTQYAVGGCDPYDINKTIDARASNGGFHIVTKRTINENVPNYQFVLEYIERPPLARQFYEDVLKACFFYGVQVLVEDKNRGIFNYFENMEYYDYLMDRPKRTLPKNERYNKKVRKGVPPTIDVITQSTEAIQFYIEEKCGFDEDNNAGDMYFNRTLLDWSKFDPNNRTVHDASVSSGLALLGVIGEVKKEPKKFNKPLVRKYKIKSSNLGRR